MFRQAVAENKADEFKAVLGEVVAIRRPKSP
jgi:hypothetical protein